MNHSLDPARDRAVRILAGFETRTTPIESQFTDLDSRLSRSVDRRFARKLILGVLRWRHRIDWVLGQFAVRPISASPLLIRQVLRLGTYQILWLDRVPESAAVDTSVELARTLGHKNLCRFVNGILRNIARNKDRVAYPDRNGELPHFLSVYHSQPQWLVERWLKRWGPESTEMMLTSMDRESPLHIRRNPAAVDEVELIEMFDADIRAVRPVGPVSGFLEVEHPDGLFDSHAYRAGWFHVQDINAGLAVALLDPQPGDRVLDLCSAPGGKAMQIAQDLNDRGMVIAADINRERLRLVSENSQRLRLSCVHIVTADAATTGKTHFPIVGPFDRVLVDVPCSGTGTLGRHPEYRWQKSPAHLKRLATVQQRILGRAFDLLRPGGVLVYSTCSLEPEENQQVVEGILKSNRLARLDPASERFPGECWASSYVETIPGRDPGDGAFAARIRKTQ